MSKQTADDLRAARSLIEQGWCQWAVAETAFGRVVPPSSPAARRFCAAGAIERVTRVQDRAFAAFQAFSDAAGGWSVVGFNDSPTATREKVLAAFDRAIAAEEAGD